MTAIRILDTATSPELAAAFKLLDQHVRDAAQPHEPVLVRQGDRLFVLFPLSLAPESAGEQSTPSWPVDREMAAVSMNPGFRAMIEEARRQADQGLGIPVDEVRRRLDITEEERAAVLRRRQRRSRSN